MRVLILFLSLCVSFSVFAEVGYVDIEKVINGTKVGKDIQKRVNKELENRRSAIQKKEKELQDRKVKFDEEASLLSDTEKRKRAQEMQIKLAEFRQSVQINEQELLDYRMKLITGLIDDLKPVIAKIAKEKKLTRVERLTEDVLWVPTDRDLTTAVIKASK